MEWLYPGKRRFLRAQYHSHGLRILTHLSGNLPLGSSCEGQRLGRSRMVDWERLVCKLTFSRPKTVEQY